MIDYKLPMNPFDVFDRFHKLPKWEQTLRSHVILARALLDDNMLDTVYNIMQQKCPGDYTLILVNNDINIVFNNEHKELLWKIKYS